MRLLNFLLAFDAVGGLTPPADLVTAQSNKTDWLLIFSFVLGYALGITTALVIKKIRTSNKNDESNKGDE